MVRGLEYRGMLKSVFVVLASLVCPTWPTFAEELPDWASMEGAFGGLELVRDPTCDFDERKCTIDECAPLNFDIFFNGPSAPVPICVFADPRTLPEGAVFPPQVGIGMVRSKFDWTPDECQAGTHVVHFHVNFECFNLFNAGIFPVTVNVSDAKVCEDPGACCTITGMCLAPTTRQDCSEPGDIFLPNQDDCDAIIKCENVVGSCCKPDGTCVETYRDTCTIYLGGEFGGEGTHCEQRGVRVCTGACSRPDSTCVNGLSKGACEGVAGSEFLGAGTVCGEVTSSGACCFPDARCFLLPNRVDCERRRGVYQGRGTQCGAVVCLFTGGACCGSNPPSCTETDPTRCALQGGAFVAAGVHCPSPTKCPPAVGACCFFDDRRGDGLLCTNGTTHDNCIAGGGSYLGDGSVCGDSDRDGVHDCEDACPNTPPGEPVLPSNPLGGAGCSCSQRPALCNDGDRCTRDVCAPRAQGADRFGCLHRPIAGCCRTDADCNDNDACTNDVCTSGACSYITVSCEDDGIRCTDDRCDRAQGCNVPRDELCEDFDRCTANFCNPSRGCEAFPVDCADGFPCTLDSCDPETGCYHAPRDSFCDDNDPCTADTCNPAALNAQPDGCTNKPRQERRECGDGDLNTDGVVDLGDLGGVIDCLNRSGPGTFVNKICQQADHDGDGDVDLADFSLAQLDPFRCDPAQCQQPIGGLCSPCPPPTVCVSERGDFAFDEPQRLGGDRPDCRMPCETTADCDFAVSRCLDCINGFCKTRCDPVLCLRPCDGAGNCPPMCQPNETCVDGRCKRSCVLDQDCNLDNCEECRDRACVSRCPADQRCVRLSGRPGVCSSPCRGNADCPACYVCRGPDPSTRGCVPCESAGQICREGVCRGRCIIDNNCIQCQHCVDGVCIDDCPKGQICAPIIGRCRSQCGDRADCGECEYCAGSSSGPFCLACPEPFFCTICDEGGDCRSQCSRQNCEVCGSSGRCDSLCRPEEVCDGQGRCVPR